MRDIRGIKRKYMGKNVFARPNGLSENAYTAFLGKRIGPARKKRYTSSRKEQDAQMCPCGKATESRTHVVGECEMYKGERGVLEMKID